jgi:Protein tyrosine and serine/threonine kinase
MFVCSVAEILGLTVLCRQVADFGYSRFFDTGSDYINVDEGVGPIKWMSPESLRKRVYSKGLDPSCVSLPVVL